MLKAVLFDLDGTLLPMDEQEFTKGYFGLLCRRLAPLGYDKDLLIKTVWEGTKLMLKNDGSKTNEEVFWNYFASIYRKDKLKDKEEIDNFYLTDFKNSKVMTKNNPYAKEIVDFIRNLGLKTIIASNPVFPKDGMLTRMGFINLKESDFDYITSYEVSHFCKPNTKYYEEVLKKNNLKPDEVIYFCNNESDDYIPATKCNITSYYIGDCIMPLSKESKIHVYKYEEVKDIILKEISKRQSND